MSADPEARLRAVARALGFTAAVKKLLPESLRVRLVLGAVMRARGRIAARHLAGEGLEIGALHFPLRVPRRARVRYVDVAPPEEVRRRNPELAGARLVQPDYLEDGFTLPGIPSSSQDFVIANQVLEHTPNPLQALHNWARALRPGGVLFVTVPVAEACFDRGRPETTLEHLVEDYELCRCGDTATFAERNLEHYVEWVSISAVNQCRDAGHELAPPSRADAETQARTLAAAGEEIHFHTFSAASFAKLAEHFAATAGFSVAEIADLGGEVVAVLRKGPGTAAPA